jgi:hypothetical protein
MTNPLEMTAAEFITHNGGDILESFSDDFKGVNGWRPRGELYTAEKATRFYNMNYEVEKSPEFSTGDFWLTPKQHILDEWELERQWNEQQDAEYELNNRWEAAELSGDFSAVRGDFESELTTEQGNFGSFASLLTK